MKESISQTHHINLKPSCVNLAWLHSIGFFEIQAHISVSLLLISSNLKLFMGKYYLLMLVGTTKTTAKLFRIFKLIDSLHLE